MNDTLEKKNSLITALDQPASTITEILITHDIPGHLFVRCGLEVNQQCIFDGLLFPGLEDRILLHLFPLCNCWSPAASQSTFFATKHRQSADAVIFTRLLWVD